MKKRILSAFLIFCMAFSTLPISVFATQERDIRVSSLTFNDVTQNDWFFEAVQFVYTKGIMDGVGGNQIAPNHNFTRAQIVATLFRVHNARPANASDSRDHAFTDVSVSAWYAPYVAWAANRGIVAGVGNNLFAPDRSLTRQEFATILFRYAAQMTDRDVTVREGAAWNNFTDRDQIASWAEDALIWANFNGLIRGRTPSTIAPRGTSSRAEAAMMLMRFLGGGRETEVQVVTGLTHSMALHADGSLWVWGENTFGQLGTGRFTTYGPNLRIVENHDVYSPQRLLGDIVDIAAGDGFSLAVNRNGELFSWGRNEVGQLGDGTRVNRAVPAKILDDVVFVDARGGVAIAITADGGLWTWGHDVTRPWEWDEETSLWAHSTRPTRVMDSVASAAAGGWHILMLTQDGQLYGIGAVSSLGIYDGNPNLSPTWGENPFVATPIHILSDIRTIAANHQTSFALTREDRLYGWGPNVDGDIGSGSNAFWVNLPEFVMADVYAVFPGNMLRRNDGSLWIWGGLYGSFLFRATSPDGQGIDAGGIRMDSLIQYGNQPIQLMHEVLTAVGGGSHFLAVDGGGTLFAWGDNQFGQLGTGAANVYGFELVDHTGHGIYSYWPYAIIENHQAASPARIGYLTTLA